MAEVSTLTRKATVIRGWVTTRNTIALHDTEFILSGGASGYHVPFSQIDSMEVLSPSKAVFVHKGDRIEIRLPGPRSADFNFLKTLWDRAIAANPTVKHNDMVAEPKPIWLENYRGLFQVIGGLVGAGLLYFIVASADFKSAEQSRYTLYLVGFLLGYGITWLVLQPIISAIISVKG